MLLLFFVVILVLVLAMVFLSQIYPRMTGRAEGEAEQELTGVGPDNAKVGPDPDLTG